MRRNQCSRGFTLVEVMFASGVLAVVFAATITILQFHNIQTKKAMEKAMMLDFCQHYLEIARNQPFTKIEPGNEINTLYDGEHGAPDIRFPAESGWHTVLTEDFQNFHPALEWFESREPQYRCEINEEIVDNEVRSRHIDFEVRWLPPLSRGAGNNSIQLEVVVYPEIK